LAIAIGSDGSGGTTARLGAINTAGPAWQSSRGGRIDRRIIVDARLARSEEGGPVLDCAGATLGVSCFGPRRQLIVIPSSTIDRIAPILLADGHVARGWLGAALQPVALPDALKPAAGHATGMMVMSIADGGPSAKAGVLAGDILVAVGGEPAQRFRRIAALLGPESIGKEIALKLIRSGAIVDFKATVTARPVT
jgi:S1-C subfamily serine protease